MNPKQDPFLQAGAAILKGIAWLYVRVPNLWDLASLALLLGLVLLGIVIYRMTLRAASLAWQSPRAYRAANGPFVAPLAGFFGGLGAAMVAPGYLPGAITFRPEWWPNWGFLEPIWVLRGEPVLVLVGLFGLTTFLTRLRREKVIRTARGMSHWAAWSDVTLHANWKWVIPMFVHFRGTAWEWSKGAGRTLLALASDAICRHILLVGQTGSGKGYCIFGPIIASSRQPFVYQDFKAECPGLALLKKRTGREPIRWGAASIDGWQSMAWNPLEEARQAPNPMDQYKFLSGLLIPSRGESDWVADLSRPILAWIFARGGYPTLGHVYDDLVQLGVPTVLGRSGVPGGLLAALEGKNVKEYLGTTIFSALASFSDGWGRKVTSAHDFTISEIFERGGYVLSAESDVASRTPIIIFWRFVIDRIVGSNRKLNCSLLFDEALAAGRIPDVSTVLETARSKGVSCVFGVQHLDGIKRVYREDADGLISGFASRIWLINGLSAHDQKMLLEGLGQRVVEESGRDGKKEKFVVPLMTADDLSRRANQFEKFWGVVDANGATKSGSKILAQFVGVGGLTRQPTAEEMEAEVAASQTMASSAVEYLPTPDLGAQAATAEMAPDEVAAALDVARQLEAGLLAAPEALTAKGWAVTAIPIKEDEWV